MSIVGRSKIRKGSCPDIEVEGYKPDKFIKWSDSELGQDSGLLAPDNGNYAIHDTSASSANPKTLTRSDNACPSIWGRKIIETETLLPSYIPCIWSLVSYILTPILLYVIQITCILPTDNT